MMAGKIDPLLTTGQYPDKEERWVWLSSQLDLPEKETWFTWERKQAAIHSSGDGLQLHHIHWLPNVYSAGHAPQSPSHKLRHLLHSEHLQELIKDGWEGVEECSLQKHVKVWLAQS